MRRYNHIVHVEVNSSDSLRCQCGQFHVISAESFSILICFYERELSKYDITGQKYLMAHFKSNRPTHHLIEDVIC